MPDFRDGSKLNGAVGKNLRAEIDDLADKGLILPIMKDWSHEVRELANEGTHPQPGSTGTDEKDAKDVVEFLTFLMRVMFARGSFAALRCKPEMVGRLT